MKERRPLYVHNTKPASREMVEEVGEDTEHKKEAKKRRKKKEIERIFLLLLSVYTLRPLAVKST